MIDFNYDIVQTLQADLLKNVVSSQRVATNPIKSASKAITDEAVNAEISNSVNSEINNIISEEDTTINKLNIAKSIYNKLGQIRLEIADIIDVLHNPEQEHTIESLTELDNTSNILIEKVIGVIQEDNVGILGSNHLKNFISGMNFLKTLKLDDKDYIFKVKEFMSSVSSKQNYYFDYSKLMNSKIEELNKKYEELVANKNNKNSKEVQSDIVKNSNSTLASVTKNLTPENVMRLLNP